MKNHTTKLVSVIMPCYNADHFIKISIQSVLDQTYKNIELIIIDDGSTDRSLEIAQTIGLTDKRVHVISQQNKRAAAARNRGLDRAKGEFVAFLDADDYWSPKFIETLHNYLTESNHSADVAYCGWQNIGLKKGDGKPFIPEDYSDCDLVELFLSDCLWPVHGVLVKKKSLLKANGFNELCKNCEDYDLWLRMSPFIKVVRVPEVMAYYRMEAQQKKDRAKIAIGHWRIQEDFLSKNPGIVTRLGLKRVKELTLGELLRRGYICYWDRNIEASRIIFKSVMKNGYGKLKDWKYMMPSLLPLKIHNFLIKYFTST